MSKELKALEKIGKINDITKVLSASKNGFWIKQKGENLFTHEKICNYIYYDYAYCYVGDGVLWIANIERSYSIYQYGETWALTKEELENKQ